MNFNRIALLLCSVIGISGCVGNQNDTGHSSKLNSTSELTSINTEGQLNEVDLLQLNYDLRKKSMLTGALGSTTTCTKDNSICADYISNIGATYTMGRGDNYFMVKDYPAAITLKFNNKLPPGSKFGLKELFTDLGPSKEQVGEILQVDTSKCDALVAGGVSPGASCRIDYVYSGVKENAHVNYTHFIFGVGDENNLELTVANQNGDKGGQNYPALNTLSWNDILFYNNIPVENNSNTGIVYNNSFGISLNNYGDGDVPAITSSKTPTIRVFLGKAHHETITSLYYLTPRDQTTYAFEKIEYGQSGSFGAYALPNSQASDLSTDFGRILFRYNLNGVESQDAVEYTKGFIMGKGDLAHSDVNVISNESHVFSVFKPNVSSPYLAYSHELENVKFSVIADPRIYIGSQTTPDKNRVSYSYGGYGDVSQQEMLDSIKFTFDQKCFGGFNPEESDNEIEGRSCQIGVKLDPRYIEKTKLKPVSGLLVADYYSPVEQRNVHQIVGKFNMEYANKPVTFTTTKLYEDGTSYGRQLTIQLNNQVYTINDNESATVNNYFDTDIVKYSNQIKGKNSIAMLEGELKLSSAGSSNNCEVKSIKVDNQDQQFVTCINKFDDRYKISINKVGSFYVIPTFRGDKSSQAESFGDYVINSATISQIKSGDHHLVTDGQNIINNNQAVNEFHYKYYIGYPDGSKGDFPEFNLSLVDGNCYSYKTTVTDNINLETCVKKVDYATYKIATSIKDAGMLKNYNISYGTDWKADQYMYSVGFNISGIKSGSHNLPSTSLGMNGNYFLANASDPIVTANVAANFAVLGAYFDSEPIYYNGNVKFDNVAWSGSCKSQEVMLKEISKPIKVYLSVKRLADNKMEMKLGTGECKQ
jgi:hypothetical protein